MEECVCSPSAGHKNLGHWIKHGWLAKKVLIPSTMPCDIDFEGPSAMRAKGFCSWIRRILSLRTRFEPSATRISRLSSMFPSEKR